MQGLSADLNNLQAKMHAQEPACKDINMNQLEEDIDYLENLASAAIKDKAEASNIAHEVAEEGNGNHILQPPTTTQTPNHSPDQKSTNSEQNERTL